MADQTYIMPHRPYEAAADDKPTTIAAAFSALMTALPLHIAAEREIEDVDIWNPAFRHWLTDAEAAFTVVTGLLWGISAAAIERAEDKPLQRMSMLLDRMVGSEEPGAFRHYHALLLRFAPLFRCGGHGVIARHCDAMLVAAFTHIETMSDLLTYDDPGFSAANMPNVVIEPV